MNTHWIMWRQMKTAPISGKMPVWELSGGQKFVTSDSEFYPHGSDTTEWLHFHFSLSCVGEGNGNPLQCSCLENPRDWGAWWAAVYGVAQSRTWLKRLSGSSSSNKEGVGKVLHFDLEICKMPRRTCLQINARDYSALLLIRGKITTTLIQRISLFWGRDKNCDILYESVMTYVVYHFPWQILPPVTSVIKHNHFYILFSSFVMYFNFIARGYDTSIPGCPRPL